MKFLDDCYEILKFSSSWIDDKETRSLFWTLFAVVVVGGLLFLGGTVAGGLVKSNVLTMASLIFAAIAYVVFMYFYGKVILTALSKKGFGNANYGPVMFLKILVVMIAIAVAAAILFFVATAAAVMLPPVISIPLVIIGGLLAFYVFCRLFLWLFIYLSGAEGIIGSFKRSWSISSGKLGFIFGRLYFTACLVQGGVYAFIMPFYVLFMLLTMMSIALTIAGQSSIIFMVVLAVFGLLAAILMPALTFVYSYMMADIYSQVDTPKAQGQKK